MDADELRLPIEGQIFSEAFGKGVGSLFEQTLSTMFVASFILFNRFIHLLG